METQVGNTKITVGKPAWLAAGVLSLVFAIFAFGRADIKVEHVRSGGAEEATVVVCVKHADTGKSECEKTQNVLTQYGQQTMLTSGLGSTTYYVRLFTVPAWAATSASFSTGKAAVSTATTPPTFLWAKTGGTTSSTQPSTFTNGQATDNTVTWQTVSIPLADLQAATLTAAGIAEVSGSGYPGTNSTTFGAAALGTNNCPQSTSLNCYARATSTVTWTAGATISNINMAAICTSASGVTSADKCISVIPLSVSRTLASGDQLTFTNTTSLN
jgi:hypothetical protein